MSRQTTEMVKRRGSGEPTAKPEPKHIEALAYQLWNERGSPIGDDQQDWYRAEEQLRKGESVQRAA